MPFSNGYAACVMNYQGKVYYGMSTNAGVGIYSYDPAAEVIVKWHFRKYAAIYPLYCRFYPPQSL